MRLLERVVEQPHPCAYLPNESASLEMRVLVDVSAAELEALLERGWRRFGPIYFRPVCRACSECIGLRVVVASFAPSKSQKRAARSQQRLRRVVGIPRVDSERLALYAKWHADRERLRGWEPNPQSRSKYALEFAFPHPAAREAALYDDADGGRLVGLGLFDEAPHALSAVFFFHDPAYARLSLGTSNVLALIEDARAAGRTHVYLGYSVEGCPSLRYKAGFRPHELLHERPGADEQPPWQTVDGSVPAPGAPEDSLTLAGPGR